MSKKTLGLVALLWVCNCVYGTEVTLNPNHPGSYVVVRGDTLWDISGRFLNYPWQWPDVWHANPHIENPHLIYPGDVVSLTYRDGRPILSVSRGGKYAGGRNVKLSPSIREYAHDDAIPPIPLDAIQQFLSRPLVVSEEEIRLAPYVLASQDDHLVSGPGSRIYLGGLIEPTANQYAVLRPGGEYRDPITDELLGHEALHIGNIRLERLGDPATGIVLWCDREILKGDRIMVPETGELPVFIPHAPASDVDGRIVSVIDGVSQIGQYMVIVINRGLQDGIQPGHVVAIYQRGAKVKDRIAGEIAWREQQDAYARAETENPSRVGRVLDTLANDFRAAKYAIDRAFGEPVGGQPVEVQLPSERAGEAMVFRAFDQLSYALVMNTHQPVHVADEIRNP